eukprot:COSAG04_NODE_1845_length_5416_cov_26.535076_4_plen_167_part_00
MLGTHWYSSMGAINSTRQPGPGGGVNVLASLARYRRPIWITEADRSWGSAPAPPPPVSPTRQRAGREPSPAGEAAQAQYLETALAGYAELATAEPLLQAVIIYELLDQPAFQSLPPPANREGFFGLVEVKNSSTGDGWRWEVGRRKPAFHAVAAFNKAQATQMKTR